MKRGEIWWSSLSLPGGSGPGFRRPVVIIQSNEFNRSQINTVIVAVMTSNLVLANAPGNVRVSARSSGLKKASVVNVSQVITIDKSFLAQRAGVLNSKLLREVEDGLRLILEV